MLESQATRQKRHVALGQSDHFGFRASGQELAEPPDAAVIEAIGAIGPAGLEVGQFFRHRQPVPFVADVQQLPAGRAGVDALPEVERRGAVGVDALLEYGSGRHGSSKVCESGGT